MTIKQKKIYYDIFLRPLPFLKKNKVIFRKVKNFLPGKASPNTLVLGLTYKCQLNCLHCGIKKDNFIKQNELTTKEMINVIDQAYELGVYYVNFTGGEPLLRKDLNELINYAAEKGLITAVSTNALALTPDKLKQLKNNGLMILNISIDSVYPKIHDELRQYSGSFQKAKEAVAFSAREGIQVFVSTCASRKNINKKDDLELISGLAKKLGAKGLVVRFPVPAGKWIDKYEEVLSEEEKKNIYGCLDSSYAHIGGICNKSTECNSALKKLFYVSPYGDIQPCNFVPFCFGNIRKECLSIIWQKMLKHNLYKISGFSGCIMRNREVREKYIKSPG